MIESGTLILSESKVTHIIRRMAFEIHENNFDEKEIVLVGIYDKGYQLAQLIKDQLSGIRKSGKLQLVRLDINKLNPVAEEVKLGIDPEKLEGKAIVVVDDVLNSGKTLAHSLSALLKVQVKKLEVAVLVNRSHKSFPISAKYKGYELSTTIDEHVEVRLEGELGAYLHA